MIEQKQEEVQGQVQAQIQELSGTLGELDTAINALDARLVSVLDRPRVKEDEKTLPNKELVPLAENLRNEVTVLHRLVATLNILRQRVEL